MAKLLEFGRKVMFYARVLSGYEERRIRSYRLYLQKQQQQAQARKDQIRRIPEQVILREVRYMVEEMQTLKCELEKAEAKIEEYFKPIDNQAHIIMNMQLEKEEKQIKEMIKAVREQQAEVAAAALQKGVAEKQEGVNDVDLSHAVQDTVSSPSKQEQAK